MRCVRRERAHTRCMLNRWVEKRDGERRQRMLGGFFALPLSCPGCHSRSASPEPPARYQERRKRGGGKASVWRTVLSDSIKHPHILLILLKITRNERGRNKKRHCGRRTPQSRGAHEINWTSVRDQVAFKGAFCCMVRCQYGCKLSSIPPSPFKPP